MNKEGTCNGMSCASWVLTKFLGAFLLIMGANALLNYAGTVQFLMEFGGGLQIGTMQPVADIVTQVVAYVWPIAMTVIGLSYLANYKKCWANNLFLLFLLVFAIGHVMSGQIAGATYDLVIVLMVACMKAFGGMGKAMCK
jgi:hypothetical protein